MNITNTIDCIINLYNTYGNEKYFGECVSKKEHMIQAAVSAQQHNETNEVILACLLHDIGHLLGKDDMNGLGVCDHGKVGRLYLEQINMDKKVCKLVENHVNAKKYLVSTDTTYYNKLSEASKQTLEYQGGKMTPEEITIFQNDPDFISMIAVRFHDDNGKEINVTNLPSIEDFIPLIKKYLL